MEDPVQLDLTVIMQGGALDGHTLEITYSADELLDCVIEVPYIAGGVKRTAWYQHDFNFDDQGRTIFVPTRHIKADEINVISLKERN